jgi:hypothetical protein
MVTARWQNVKSALRLTDNVDDGLIEKAIESASRRIDGYTGRFFYKTSSTSINIYPINEYLLRMPQDLSNDTITIKIDTTQTAHMQPRSHRALITSLSQLMLLCVDTLMFMLVWLAVKPSRCM